jgi:hypothetical protein
VRGECDLDGSALTIREDDRSATLLERLRIYEQETAPILGRYARKACLLEVDGEQPKENIAQEIVPAIQSMLRISIAGTQNVQSMLENSPRNCWTAVSQAAEIQNTGVAVLLRAAFEDSEKTKCHTRRTAL